MIIQSDEPVAEKSCISFRKTQTIALRKKKELCLTQTASCMNIYELFRAKPSSGTAHRGWLMDYMYQRNVEKSNNTDIVHHHKVPINDIDVNKNFVAHACGTNSAGQFNGQHGIDNDGVESDQVIDQFSEQHLDGDGGIIDHISGGLISKNVTNETDVPVPAGKMKSFWKRTKERFMRLLCF